MKFNKFLIILLLSYSSLSPEILLGAEKGFDKAQLFSEPTRTEIKNIRVKIFPHKHNFAPHGLDTVVDRFVVSSPSPCTASPVENLFTIPAKPAQRVLFKASRISLVASTLRAPMMLDCPKGFALVRPGHKTSYEYMGSLLVMTKADKKDGRLQLVAINTVDLERYLAGVVPAEVVPSWPMESLKSQAVAARTYGVYHMLHARIRKANSLYDVDDSVLFQAYTGTSGEHARTSAAVEATSGEVIVFGDKVIPAYYHADSGGEIASCSQISNLQADSPYCQKRKEPLAVFMASRQWRKILSVGEINFHLIGAGKIDGDNPAVNIRSNEKSGERVTHLDLQLQDGTNKVLTTSEFKKAINLDSSWFAIRQIQIGETKHFEFIGRGSGHGVGMSQNGARFFAESYNWDYEKILKYYYSGAVITRS